MEIEKVQRKLLIMFWMLLSPAAILYVLGEFLQVDLALLEGAPDEGKFVASTIVILATLAIIPLSLRLFRFNRVKCDLSELGAIALLGWARLRMLMLGGLLLVNELLYYLLGFETSYGYLALILLLAMPFVYPTKNRCLTELESAKA